MMVSCREAERLLGLRIQDTELRPLIQVKRDWTAATLGTGSLASALHV